MSAKTETPSITFGIQAILILASMILPCRGAQILWVHPHNGNPVLSEQVSQTARFYGLDVREIEITDRIDTARFKQATSDGSAVAAVIESSALSNGGTTAFLAALASYREKRLPVMIVVTPSNSLHTTKLSLPDGVDLDCPSNRNAPLDLRLRVSQGSELAPELTGVELPFAGHEGCGLRVPQSFAGKVQLLVDDQAGTSMPILAESTFHGAPLFTLAWVSPEEGKAERASDRFVRTFAARAPLFLFLRYAAGPKAWHPPSRYANLTVDDPWLVEPYGNLNYHGLLDQMDEHGYHTTIAFIPWNFDRNHADVVDLIRQHPQRFSIAIHGNNHDHQEFGELRRHPIEEQLFNLRQALARMDRFSLLTGIPYDRVMVFPHNDAPAETLTQLKATGYWATLNSENNPLGTREPPDPLFLLRPQTLLYENFLGIKRYSAEIPVSTSMIAVHGFLGNPLFFYVHQEFFHANIGAFNPIANTVNRIVPDTKWASTGTLVEHMYLLKLRSPSEYDVLAFSPTLLLENISGSDAIFHIRKPESFKPDIVSVSVEGNGVSYVKTSGEIEFTVSVPPGQSRRIAISYSNPLNVKHVGVEKIKLEATLLRRIADFRDMNLTKSDLGWKLTASYYSLRLDTVEEYLEHPKVLLGLAGLGLLGFVLSVRGKKRRRTKHARLGRMPGVSKVNP